MYYSVQYLQLKEKYNYKTVLIVKNALKLSSLNRNLKLFVFVFKLVEAINTKMSFPCKQDRVLKYKLHAWERLVYYNQGVENL